MELDELKSVWSDFDRKLTENLKLNEELLIKIALHRTKSELNIPVYYEIANIIGMVLVIAYVLSSSIRFIDQPEFCIPGFVSAAIGSVYLIFAIIKTGRFFKIDYYNSAIVKLQQEIASLKMMILRFRKIELILTLPLILSLLPILFKSISNIDIYNNIILFIIELVLILGISLPITFWTIRHLYDKNIYNAEQNLSVLEKYRKEE